MSIHDFNIADAFAARATSALRWLDRETQSSYFERFSAIRQTWRWSI
jgi:hypothetical protein